MTHLIARAYHENEERGDEFSPSHFVLEIDKPLIKILKRNLKDVNLIHNDSLASVNFYFGFGIWTSFDEWLSDTFEEELSFYHGELKSELEEQDSITHFVVTMYPDGDIVFKCYGKYDNETIYTCLVSLEELENQLDKE